jgi:hypothetical protein
MHSCDDNIKIHFVKIRNDVDLVRLIRERDQSRSIINTKVIIRFMKGMELLD